MGAYTSALGPAHVLELPEGLIRYHDRGPRDATAIVFVHGIIANADVWRGVVPRLSRQYRCITPDWPLGGHELPMRPGTDFTLDGLASLVHRSLVALDVNDVALVGNDTGGAIAQAVAAYHPQRLGSLVLTPCDAFDNFLPLPIRHLQLLGRTPAGLRLLAEALRWPAVYRLPIAFGMLTRRPIPRDVMDGYTGPLRTSATTRRDFAALVRAISRRYTEEAAAALTRFDKPTLLIWADQGFFPVRHAERLERLLPNAQLVVLGDSGPFVGEDAPGPVARLIDDFLRRSRPATAPLDGPPDAR